MSKKYITSFFLCLAYCTILTCVPAQSDVLDNAMQIRGLAIQAEANNVHIKSGILFSQTKALQSVLTEGMLARFTYTVHLAEQRTLWFSKTIAEQTRTIQLSFDPLNKLFIATQEGIIISSQNTLDKLLIKSIENLDFNLTLKTSLEAGEIYQVVMSVSIQKSTIPKWIQASLFFWSWDIVPPIQLYQNFTF